MPLADIGVLFGWQARVELNAQDTPTSVRERVERVASAAEQIKRQRLKAQHQIVRW